jgi:hypothetical protein
MAAMNLVRTFSIEDPAVDVPWGATPASFRALVAGTAVAQVTDGHYRLRCRALGVHEEFHFHFSRGGTATAGLMQVELLRSPKRHRQRIYDEMESRLGHLLGPRESGRVRSGLYPASSRWRVGAVMVTHEWYYQGAEYQKVLVTRGAR